MSNARCGDRLQVNADDDVVVVTCVRRRDHGGLHRGWYYPPGRGWFHVDDVTISGSPAYAGVVGISWAPEP